MNDEDYMKIALDEARSAAARGEVPIGAIVVYAPVDPATRRATAEPRIIARAGNMREATRDPAGHAEFLAMKAAAAELHAWRLTDCTVYVTLEPCLMCAGLMHQARISRCVWGAPDKKAGALGTLYRVNEDVRLNHTFPVTGGVLQEECAGLLSEFFAARRQRGAHDGSAVADTLGVMAISEAAVASEAVVAPEAVEVFALPHVPEAVKASALPHVPETESSSYATHR